MCSKLIPNKQQQQQNKAAQLEEGEDCSNSVSLPLASGETALNDEDPPLPPPASY